jgi:hypothetical protein
LWTGRIPVGLMLPTLMGSIVVRDRLPLR